MSGSDGEQPENPVPPGSDPARHTPSMVQSLVTGARHLREGKVCQDAVRGTREGSVVAVAIADGHGTSAHGEVGAQLAVDVAVEQLLRFAAKLGPAADPQAVYAYAQHPLRVQLVREWVERVRQHAGTDSAELQPYGSTLLFALSSPSFLLVGQLGDGDILLLDSDRQVSRPIAPDPSYFAEETASLCQKEAWEAIRLRTTPAPQAEALLLLSTDGYGKSYATDEIFEQIGPDYLDMFRSDGPAGVADRLGEILEAVTSGGSGDDIALGMLHWAAGAAADAAARGAENQSSAPAPSSDELPGNQANAGVDETSVADSLSNGG